MELSDPEFGPLWAFALELKSALLRRTCFSRRKQQKRREIT